MKLNLKSKLTNLMVTLYEMTTFVLLLMLYLTAKAVDRITGWRYFPGFIKKAGSPLSSFYTRAVKLLDHRRTGTISRINLIELSIRNMKSKKTRTVVTVGGMMIGIGTIVFLVSIGYGLQQLVITRVARLEEMRQADVAPQTGGKLKITDETLANFKDITSVKMSLPLIAVVGRVNYQNSVSDMAVYGVTTDYLKESAIKPIQGKIFDSNELTVKVPEKTGQVAGAYIESTSGEVGDKIQDIDYLIDQSSWIRVREDASTSAKILGYTKRVEGSSTGEEIWGSKYLSDTGAGVAGETESGTTVGKWIKAPVLLWKEQSCDLESDGDCEDGKYVVLRDDEGRQVQEEGYFAQINVKIRGAEIRKSPQVLGDTIEESPQSAEFVANTDSSIDWVEIASESGIIQTQDIKTVELASSAKKQAVVNRAMLKVLGINENEAVGKRFTASFVVVGDLLSESQEKIESAPTEYTIVGVTPEEKSPIFYVPFMDLRSLGVTNFSQVKVVVQNQSELAKTRQQIEAMGYVTRSVADTVAQINSLFATARTILMLLGMVALSVAALGMFNTLTVSLLERTREVGLMKAMGMKSSEVQELFLTESMIMGFFGGILGILIGYLAGKLVGLALSFFAIVKGVGFVDISYIPLPFVLVVVFLSLLVGIVTGIYPAKRATKISALNALRYE